MDSRKLALLCRAYAEDKKAENVVVIDVRKLSSVTDFFVVITGTSEPHLRAIESEIVDGLRKDHDVQPHGSDGAAQANWIAIDYFDVIVHIMRDEVRKRYDLEGLWSDAPRLRVSSTRTAPASSASPRSRKRTTSTSPIAPRTDAASEL